ncbi:hypothetical protein N2152v2_000248 [Parachlorella kessleri]
MAVPGAAQPGQNQPSSTVPRSGPGVHAPLDGRVPAAGQEPAASLQGLQAGWAEAGPACAPSPNSYFGLAHNMLQQRYNPLREGLQRLTAQHVTPIVPSHSPQRQEQQWPLMAAGGGQLAASAGDDAAAQRAAQDGTPGNTLPARSPLKAPPTASQLSSLTRRLNDAEQLQCLSSQAVQPDRRAVGLSHADDDDRMLMASPVQGALLDAIDHPAWYQQAAAITAPPANNQAQEAKLAAEQQSTTCTPKRTPKRVASNAGAMRPYECQTAAASGRRRLLTGCSPMAPASVASTAALTSPDCDLQYQYGSPAVRRPHTAAGTAGTAEPLAAGAEGALPSCPASAPSLTHLVVMNSAFSPQGGVVWGGEAVLQAWPEAGAPEAAAAAGKKPGLAPLRLAFGGEAATAAAAAVPDSLDSQQHVGREEGPEPHPTLEGETDGRALACNHLQGGYLLSKVSKGSGAEVSAPAGVVESPSKGEAVLSAQGVCLEAVPATTAQRSPCGVPAPTNLWRAQQEQQGMQQDWQDLQADVAVEAALQHLEESSTEAAPAGPACDQPACSQHVSSAPAAAGDAGSPALQPARSCSRLAALARLKTRSLHRQATSAGGTATVEQGPLSAETASLTPTSCSTLHAALITSAGTAAGCDDSLASLKLRRRLSCSAAASPGKPAAVLEAATTQGPPDSATTGEDPQSSSMAQDLIAAHRPANRRWDSAISRGSMSGSAILCTSVADSAAGCSPGVAAAGTPGSDVVGAPTMHDAWQRGPALSPDQAASCWPAEGTSPGDPPAPSPALQQPKPFLRRKSQRIAPQALPDWSQVRPRTQSRLEPDLLPGGSAAGRGGGSRCSTPRPGAAGGGLGPWSGATTPRSGRPASSAAAFLAAKQPRQPSGRPTTPQPDALGLWGIGTAASTARGTAAGTHGRARKQQPVTAPGTRAQGSSRPPWNSGRMVPTPKSKAPATAAGRATARTTPFSPCGPAGVAGTSRRAPKHWQQQEQLYHAADLMAEMQRVHGLESGSLGFSTSYRQRAYAATAAAGVQQGPRRGEEGCSGPLDDLLGQVDRLLSQVEKCR